MEKQLFTEHDFVASLLFLLCKNGVFKIEERELQQKLYSYYINPEYNELFQDITTKKGINDMEVLLYNGLHQEKYFSRRICFDPMYSNILYLTDGPNFDIEKYEQFLSENGKLKLRQLAKEFGVRYKIERNSKYKLNIYGLNPNSQYLLVNGKKNRKIVNFDLITDGDISVIKTFSPFETKNIFYESPINLDEAVQLKDNNVMLVELNNATYAIKRGICDEQIRYCRVNTQILEEYKLNQISEIANREYNVLDYMQTEGMSYVKKMTLN